MKSLFTNILSLTILGLIILAAGYFLLPFTSYAVSLPDLTTLTILFLLISVASIIVFHRGQRRDPHSRIIHTMVSVSVKLLLEMVLALFWFLISKKPSPDSVLMFFVLYLSFSLFFVLLMLKTLRNKSL